MRPASPRWLAAVSTSSTPRVRVSTPLVNTLMPEKGTFSSTLPLASMAAFTAGERSAPA